MVQIEIETQILSGARYALNAAREGQAMPDLGEYLCYSPHISTAALAGMTVQ